VDIQRLVGCELKRVLYYRNTEIHPAWKEDSTPNISTQYVYLDLSCGTLYQVSPCEISLSPNSYPSLSLSVCKLERENCYLTFANGKKTQPVELLGLTSNELISRVSISDPMGEGCATEYCLDLESSKSIIIRHIMPPMMLGLESRF